MPDKPAAEAHPFINAHARIKAAAAPAIKHVIASIPKTKYDHVHAAFKGK